MGNRLSRRGFLQSAGLAGAGFLWKPPVPRQGTDPGAPGIVNWDGSPFGRILLNRMTVYREPSWRAAPTGEVFVWNDVVPVIEAVSGVGLYHTNHTWLRTGTGYIYSSWVQPVNDYPVNPTVPIGEGGLWGVVTVPYTWTRSGPGDDYNRRERMYGSTVHRAMAVENDYYLIREIYGREYWMKASHLRIVPPEEITPLAPEVPPDDKRIEITISDQMLRAYQGDQPVFVTRVSTGVPATPTPFGEHRIIFKRTGQRMTGGLDDTYYNLPGIGWVGYFTSNYVAIHATYWHNDYGRRHSNGCVNLHPEAAKWLFRWTTPVANYWDFSTHSSPQEGMPGTRIIVRW